MLSRAPAPQTEVGNTEKESGTWEINKDDTEHDIDVPDQTYHVQALNSGNFVPKQYASFTLKQEPSDLSKLGPDLNMVEEQKKDEEISKILEEIKTKKIKNKSRYITQDGVLYYLTGTHEDPIMRLYVPAQFRANLIVAYHYENRHFVIDKYYHTLAQSYYWPNMSRTCGNISTNVFNAVRGT